MLALLILGRQFQWNICAPEPSRCNYDRGISGAKLATYKKRMGWNFTWVSSGETDFNFDYHVSFTPSREGVSVFYKDPTGDVFHTYSAYARGIDMVNVAYRMLKWGTSKIGCPSMMTMYLAMMVSGAMMPTVGESEDTLRLGKNGVNL